MRISAFSVIGAAAAILMAVALWPQNQRVPAPNAVAQAPTGGGGAPAAAKKVQRGLEEKLATRIDAEFTEIPLREILDYLKDRADIQIYVNKRAIEGGAAGALDAPVSINLQQVRVDMLLDLALEQAGESALAYMERDGILIVSTTDALSGASEVRVYNCRDLLAMVSPSHGGMVLPGMMMPGGGGGLPEIPGAGGFGLPPGGGAGTPAGPSSGGFTPVEPQPGGDEGSNKGELPPGLGIAPRDGEGGTTPPSIPKGIAPQVAGAGAAPGGGEGPPTGGGGGPGGAPPGGGGGFGAGGGGMLPPGMGGGMGMPGMPGMPGMGAMGGGGLGGTIDDGRPKTADELNADRLMHLITTAVHPDSWQEMGGFGSISEYKGLIVINHNAKTHKEVENVLKMLREAAGLPASGPVSGGMMRGTGGGFRPATP